MGCDVETCCSSKWSGRCRAWNRGGPEMQSDSRQCWKALRIWSIKWSEPAASHGAHPRSKLDDSGESVDLVIQVHEVLFRRTGESCIQRALAGWTMHWNPWWKRPLPRCHQVVAYLKMSVLHHIEFCPFLGTPSLLTFHNVNNHGGGAKRDGHRELIARGRRAKRFGQLWSCPRFSGLCGDF